MGMGPLGRMEKDQDAREGSDRAAGRPLGNHDFETTPSPCPFCDYVMDGAFNALEPVKPSPGDFSLCINCGEWCVFGDDMRLRKPSHEEYEAIVSEEFFSRIRVSWLQMKEAL